MFLAGGIVDNWRFRILLGMRKKGVYCKTCISTCLGFLEFWLTCPLPSLPSMHTGTVFFLSLPVPLLTPSNTIVEIPKYYKRGFFLFPFILYRKVLYKRNLFSLDFHSGS